jgi:hypothetical protein
LRRARKKRGRTLRIVVESARLRPSRAREPRTCGDADVAERRGGGAWKPSRGDVRGTRSTPSKDAHDDGTAAALQPMVRASATVRANARRTPAG